MSVCPNTHTDIIYTIKTCFLLKVMSHRCLSAREGSKKKKGLWQSVQSFHKQNVEKKEKFVFHTIERLWKCRCHMSTVLELEQRVATVQTTPKSLQSTSLHLSSPHILHTILRALCVSERQVNHIPGPNGPQGQTKMTNIYFTQVIYVFKTMLKNAKTSTIVTYATLVIFQTVL